ncbi:MAG: DUF1861 family protein [Sporolactobacillus sp.]
MSARAMSCRALLKAYKKEKSIVYDVKKLIFKGIKGCDIYNPTVPFIDESKQIIAGRVEKRSNEHSTICFFENRKGIWYLMENMPVFPLQDPFVTQIDGQLLLGGVEVLINPDHKVVWRTVLYKGSSVKNLLPFYVGPIGMKDLRLGQMVDGKILILTRPQGGKGGRGKIGYLLLSRLDQLSSQRLEDAPLLEDYFALGEWGGANEIHPLKNGKAGVLGHIACFDARGDRHYYSMAFTLNPLTGAHSPIEIIAIRTNFLNGPAKRPDLKDVIFTGGGIRYHSTFTLYAGTSDAEAQKIVLNDPFLNYEK